MKKNPKVTTFTESTKNELWSLYNIQKTVTEEEIDNDETKRLIIKTIKQLSHNQQIVIKLFYVEDYSLKEISITTALFPSEFIVFELCDKLQEGASGPANKTSSRVPVPEFNPARTRSPHGKTQT